MFKNNVLQFVFICFLVSIIGCKNEPKEIKNGEVLFEQSENASVKVYKKDNDIFLQKSEIKFEVIELVGEKPSTMLVSTQTVENKSLNSAKDDFKDFNIKVKNIDGKEAIAWEKTLKGSDINYDSKVLNLITAGNDQQEDTYTFFDLTSGQKIMDFTYGEMKVQIPNTSEKRFLTYISPSNALGIPVEGGIIQYANSHGIINSLQLTAKDKKLIPSYTPEIQILKASDSGIQITPDGKSIVLTSLNEHFKKEDIKGFAFKIVLYDEKQEEPYTILIPVDNDAINLENANFNRSIFTLKQID